MNNYLLVTFTVTSVNIRMKTKFIIFIMHWNKICIFLCLFPFLDEVAGYSGDFGSGVGWEDEEEKEEEDTGEEAEEEEEEEGETDDGGYIW